MTVTLENDQLAVNIDTLGAELQSIRTKRNETEQLWNGDPKFWTGRAPIMFPICGGLKDDRMVYRGTSYSLKKHGYAKLSEFSVEKCDRHAAVFLLRSDSKSRAIYPFDYEFRVQFSLSGPSLAITYEVTNCTHGPMVTSFGAHEAYACPDGLEAYSVIFEKEEPLDAWVLNGNLLEHKTVPILHGGRELALKSSYFSIDALVFRYIQSKSVLLVHRATGHQRKIEFPGFDHLLLWTKPGAGYICIEPWCNLPDFVDSDYDLDHKEGMQHLEEKERFQRTHVITFDEL